MKAFHKAVLSRLEHLADSLDRLATVLSMESVGTARPAPPDIRYHPPDATGTTPQPPQPAGFTFAESGEDYQERQSRDASFAISLGVAPWSPDFQNTILCMKRDFMVPHMENIQDEAGNWYAAQVEGRSEEEAEQLVRDAFKIARAEANIRQGAGVPGSGTSSGTEA